MARSKSRKQTTLPLNGSFPDYLQEAAGDLQQLYAFERELARGKTGVACLLRSRGNEACFACLKTIRDDITNAPELARVRETLIAEIEILSPLSHRCLPTVYQSNIRQERPYYVCTYHPGKTFNEFRNAPDSLGVKESAYVVWSLLDVLRYLHETGRTHCDLHSNNVMISAEVFRHGIMVIDFSSGHRDSDSSLETSNRGNLHFKPVEQQGRTGRRVNRSQELMAFRRADFKALGTLLALMSNKLLINTSQVTRTAYLEYCRALQDGRIDNWNEAHDRFASVIDPYRIQTENADLFLSEKGTPLEITIPVSGHTTVGEGPLAIINTDSFQRLRGIKQLSFCDWRFPGATHSRFEHSIGVFSVCKEATHHLMHDPVFREQFSPIQIRGLLLAALLHDIGHYPFAHVIEQYAASRFPDNSEALRIVSHEVHGKELLESDSELAEAIKRYWGDEALMQAKKTLDGNASVLSELIDGPIDIDKIDYLMRDASHCGIAFGDGLDAQGLLKAYRCVDNGRHLGIDEKGVSATEGLMILQDQMLSSVYWDETVRGVICMFHGVLAYLVKREIGTLRKLVAELKACRSDNDAIANVLIPWIDKFKGNEKSDLKSLISTHATSMSSRAYVPIKTYRSSDDAPRKAFMNIYRMIIGQRNSNQSSTPIEWKAVSSLREAFIEAFAEKGINLKRLHLGVDVPSGKGSRRRVVVQSDPNGPTVSITEISHLNTSIFDDPAAYLSPVRVYLAPEAYFDAGDRLKSIIEAAEERFFANGPQDVPEHGL